MFSVGSAVGAGKASSLAATLSGQSGSTTVGVLYWFIRFATFAGLILLVGLAIMVTLVWRPGGTSRRIGRLLWTSWIVLFGSTLLGIAIQGVYAAALPLTDIVRPTLVNAVLHTRFGKIELLRLVLLIAFVPVLLGIQGRIGGRERRWAWVVPAEVALGIGLLLTPGLAGHASSGSQAGLGLALDVLHLGAAAVWLGGLALLATVLVKADTGVDQPRDPAMVTLKVSSFAFTAVVVVVATGTVQAIRQVGSFDALVHTAYGRTLLVKIGLVVLLIGVGAMSRRIVHGSWGLPRTARRSAPEAVTAGHPKSGDDGWRDEHRNLRRSVLVEVGIALVVLLVTALLVNAVPAKQAAGLPFSYTFNTLGVQVNVIVDPARAGPDNQVHVYVLSGIGTPRAVPELDASISLPAQSIGPLDIPLVVAGPGHYFATHVDIPIAGTWVLKIIVRTDDINEQVVSAPLPVH